MAGIKYPDGNGGWAYAGVPVDAVRRPVGLGLGQGMVYLGDGAWEPEYLARQQELDMLREEFEQHHHDERYAAFQAVSERAARYVGNLGTGNFHIATGNAILYSGTGGSAAAMIYLSPLDWGPRGARMKLRSWVQTETAPNANTLLVRLGILTTVGAGGTIGGANNTPTSSDANVTIPGASANSVFTGVSPEFVLTTAGWYIVYFNHGVDPGQGMTYGYTLLGKPA